MPGSDASQFTEYKRYHNVCADGISQATRKPHFGATQNIRVPLSTCSLEVFLGVAPMGVSGPTGPLRPEPLAIATGQGAQGSLAYTLDGINWSPVDNPEVFGLDATYVAFDKNSRWVAVGSSNNTIAYSDDGYVWTGVGNNQFGSPNIFSTTGLAVAYGGGKWVATGQGINTIAYSTDGIGWTGATGPGTFGTGIGRGVVYGNGVWVATGNTPTRTNTISTSVDGINWTPVAGSTGIFSLSGFQVEYGNGMFVGVGQGTSYSIATSPDGVNWTGVANSKTIFSTYGFDVAYNGTSWVAVGGGGSTIATSPDGFIWTGQVPSVFTTLGLGVVWDGQKWLVGGQGSSTVGYSTDAIGTNWIGKGTSVFTVRGGGIEVSRPLP